MIMDIYVTQNSSYFVHRHFLHHFERSDCEVIYVKETNRGLRRKYFEIAQNLGFWSTLFSALFELFYFIKLVKRTSKLTSFNVSDGGLNYLLEEKIQNGYYERIISIGAPCKIEAAFQQKFNIEIINLHGGILPYQKGRFSPVKSVLKGHQFLGATLYKISDTFDDGEIVSQGSFQVDSVRILKIYNQVLSFSSQLLDDFFNKKIRMVSPKVLADLERTVAS